MKEFSATAMSLEVEDLISQMMHLRLRPSKEAHFFVSDGQFDPSCTSTSQSLDLIAVNARRRQSCDFELCGDVMRVLCLRKDAP